MFISSSMSVKEKEKAKAEAEMREADPSLEEGLAKITANVLSESGGFTQTSPLPSGGGMYGSAF